MTLDESVNPVSPTPAEGTGDLGPGVLVSSWKRLFLLQALWNYERMQGIGFAYALAPAVRALDGDDAVAARALVPHAGYFNTHPVMASVAVGVVARQLEARAHGEPALDDEGLARIKQALGASLAAVADTLFWSSVRPLVSLAAVYTWREDRSALGIVTLLVGYNAIAVGFRARGLMAGYRRGLAYVAQLPERLARLTAVVRGLGVVLAALVVSTVLVPGDGAGPGAALGGLGGVVLGGTVFGMGRLGASAWGLLLVLGALAWATLGRS